MGRWDLPRAVLTRGMALGMGLMVAFLALEIGLRFTGSFYRTPMGPTPEQLTDISQHRVFLALGDSMTYGIGSTRGNSYPEQLGRLVASRHPETSFEVVNGSMAGANSTTIRALLHDYLDLLQPEVVTVLAGGTNKINFHGFSAFMGRHTLSARLGDTLHRVRVWRLFQYTTAQLRQNTPRWQVLGFDGMAAGLAACAAWHQQHEVSLNTAFLDGSRLLELGRYDEARVLFEGALASTPQDTALLYGLACAWKGLRDKQEARAWYLRCLEVNPGDPACSFGLGELLLEGRPQGPAVTPEMQTARSWFEQGILADPGFSGNHWGLGLALTKVGDASAAVDAFMACARAAPADNRCYQNLVTQAMFCGRVTEVEALLDQLAPRSVVARDTLAAFNLRQDDPAIAAWVRSDLEAMADVAAAHGAAVVLQTYPYSDSANRVLEAVALQRGLPLADQEARFRHLADEGLDSGDLFIADGRHCNDTGYAHMAQTLYEALLGAKLLE